MRPRLGIFWLVLLAAFTPARADEPTSGVTTGTVAARADDFFFVREPGGVGRRYTFRPAATGPARNARPAFDAVHVDDEIEVRWTTVENRRRITSVRLLGHATRPDTPGRPATTAATATPMPATAPAAIAPPITTGERVNALIDDLLAVCARLLELPMSVLLAAVAVGGGVLFAAARRLDRIGRPTTATRLRRTLGVIGVLFVALLIDRKIAALQTQVNDLRSRLSADALARPNGPAAARPSRPLMVDPAAAQHALAVHFKDVTLTPNVYDKTTDVVTIGIGDPLVQAYLAVVDLTNPAVEIKLGTTLDRKTLTSAFAKENDCTLAINGEAGQSPAMNSGLGPWRGHMVYRSQVVLQEQPGNPRPFLSFDVNHRATFTAMAAAGRAVPAGKPTVIWGRLDSVVAGVVQTADARNRQPRTAMATTADGKRLYLLVVDGRQPGYSMGVTRAEVGYLLAAFGATDGMLCDEGGSSCLYLKQSGGIANIPSDNNGEERATYTHFGVTVHDTH